MMTKKITNSILSLIRNGDIENLTVDYYQPLNETTLIGHFGFDQSPKSPKTVSEMEENLSYGLKYRLYWLSKISLSRFSNIKKLVLF